MYKMRSELDEEFTLSDSEEDLIDHVIGDTLQDTVIYVLYSSVALLLVVFIMTTLRMLLLGQKARNNQQRRPYIGSRSRNSLPQADPTIYVSPANLTPPPKYEAMAPPSYEEVVGIHYPSFTPTQIQPIAQPIATAMAQNASASSTADVPENRNPGDQTINPPTVITVTNERTVVTASS
ncbi:uncharacterized protein [Battus philenor]|uniref:uncharacterized protein isoform X2 n=1 Tax=Battus philenor TaxID=42288 RepID=UPI0035CEDCA2